MPTQTICAKCNKIAVGTPYGIGFFRDDTKAYDKIGSTCYDEMTTAWTTKPNFVKK